MQQVYDCVLSSSFKCDYDLAYKNPTLRKRLLSLHAQLRSPFDSGQAEKLTGGAYTPRYSLRVNDDYRIIFDLSDSTLVYRVLDKHDPSYRRAKVLQAPDLSSLLALQDLYVNKVRPSKAKRVPSLQISLTLAAISKAEPVGIKEVSLDSYKEEQVVGPEKVQASTKASEVTGTPSETSEVSTANPARESYLLLADDAAIALALSADIAQWMLFLPDDHRAHVTRVHAGPSRLCGPSGTGKTCILLHRAVYLASAERAPVLVVTFRPTLAKVLTRLKDKLCQTIGIPGLQVLVLDLQTLASRVGGCQQTLDVARQAQLLRTARSIVGAPPETFQRKLKSYQDLDSYVHNEVMNWIKGTNYQPRELYKVMNFPRGKGELNSAERAWFFDIYLAYEQAKGDLLDDQDVLALAQQQAERPGFTSPWKCVLVDEFQDMNRSALCLMKALAAASPEQLSFAGDHRQRIYHTLPSFSEAEIKIKGRSRNLSVNYRNTPEIYAAAKSLCVSDGEDPDREEAGDDAALQKINCLRASEARPVLRAFTTLVEEQEWVCQQIDALARAGVPLGNIAVLSLNLEQTDHLAYLARTILLDNPRVDRLTYFSQDAVKRATIPQAKGLEFPIVFLVGLSQAAFAADESVRAGDEAESIVSALLYVAMTRARDRLTLTYAGKPLRALRAARPEYFSIYTETAATLASTS